MSEVIAEAGDYRVRLEHDQDCEDPRVNNDAIEIVTPRLRFWSVRTKDALLQEAFERLSGYGPEKFVRYAKIFHGITLYAVYMYEHSGVALSATSFLGRAQHAEWDSGQIGYAYVPPEKRWEGIDEEAAVKSVIEELGQWMNGESYGYIVERKAFWMKLYADPNRASEEGWDWEEVESCWGFIGSSYAEEAAREAMDDAMKEAA